MSNAADKKVRIGFVGAGRMGREHIRAFGDIAGVELAGIVSRTRSHSDDLANEFRIGRSFDRIADLLAETPLDLLVVAVPEMATAAVMSECLAAKVPVLVEKPIGVDLADCRKVHDLAASLNVPVFVGLNRRSYGSTVAAAESIAQDEGPRFIELHDQEDIAAARAAGQPEDVVRNWMFANSIHIIDYFRIFGRGNIVDVTPVDAWDGRVPSQVIAHVKFSSGDTGLYCAVWNRPGPWSCAVTTDARRLEMRPMEQCRVQLSGSRQFADLPQDAWDLEFKPGFRRQAQGIADFVRHGVRPAHVPDIAEALTTTELVARLYSLPA